MDRQKTVLLVDDEEDGRTIYRVLLEHSGYHVLEAADGGEALLLARSELPDLIVMNVTMPTFNGVDATEMLKEDPDTAHIPVIVLTGHEIPRIMELAWQAGCDDVLQKPFAPTALEAEVRRRIGPPAPAGG